MSHGTDTAEIAAMHNGSGLVTTHDRELAGMQRILRATALAGVVIVLLVTTSSAWLRLRGLGLGCDDWPRCYAQADALSAAAGPSIARILHRLSATLAGAAVLGIALIAAARARAHRRELMLAAAMLVLLLGLAWLGRATPGATVPAIAIGNVLGGLLLAALLFWLALDPQPRPARGPAWLPVASALALLLAFAQIALGVLTSASHSGLACSGFPGCAAEGFPGAWAAAELDPWRTAAPSASIHMAHRVATLASAGAVTLVAWALRGPAPLLAGALFALLAIQIVLGVAVVVGSLPLAIAVLHNVGATFLLLALVAAHHRSLRLGKA